MQADEDLIRQVEMLLDGKTNHRSANLVAVYRSAIVEYNLAGSIEIRTIARTAESDLRILLSRLRLQRAGLSARQPQCA